MVPLRVEWDTVFGTVVMRMFRSDGAEIGEFSVERFKERWGVDPPPPPPDIWIDPLGAGLSREHAESFVEMWANGNRELTRLDTEAGRLITDRLQGALGGEDRD